MRTIYLDQMHWIQLSRVYHGRSTDPTLRAVLDFVMVARENGRARFPLSMAHYIETAKRGDVGSRARLAEVQREFSVPASHCARPDSAVPRPRTTGCEE